MLAFLDKERALQEVARVLKPGGRAGFNEATWVGEPPLELAEYVERVTGASFETPEGWAGLLQRSGLEVVEARVKRFKVLNQLVEEVRYIGLWDFLRGWARFLWLTLTNGEFRRYMRSSWPPKGSIGSFLKHLGYGLYLCQARTT